MSFVSALNNTDELCPSNIKKHAEGLLDFFLSIEITGSENRHESICIPPSVSFISYKNDLMFLFDTDWIVIVILFTFRLRAGMWLYLTVFRSILTASPSNLGTSFS